MGRYEVWAYEVGGDCTELVLPRLELKEDMSFRILSGDGWHEGEWEANDYGDWTLVEFSRGGKGLTTMMDGRDSLVLGDPSAFGLEGFGRVTFRRIGLLAFLEAECARRGSQIRAY